MLAASGLTNAVAAIRRADPVVAGLTGQATAIRLAAIAVLAASRVAESIAAIGRTRSRDARVARAAAAISRTIAAILACRIAGSVAAGGNANAADAVLRTWGATAITRTIGTIFTCRITEIVAAGGLALAGGANLSARVAAAIGGAGTAIFVALGLADSVAANIMTFVNIRDGADHLLGLGADGNRSRYAICAASHRHRSQIARASALRRAVHVNQAADGAIPRATTRSVYARNTRVVSPEARARAGRFPDRVIAGLDRDVAGAISIVGVGELSRAVDLQIEQPGVVFRESFLAHLDGTGNLNWDLQRGLRFAFRRRSGERAKRRTAKVIVARLSPACSRTHIQKTVVVRIKAGQRNIGEFVLDRIGRGIDIPAEVLEARTGSNAGAAKARAIAGVVTRSRVISGADEAGVERAVKVGITAETCTQPCATGMRHAVSRARRVIDRRNRQRGDQATCA